eukprot:21512-Heterococcus_DN1.PRE.2
MRIQALLQPPRHQPLLLGPLQQGEAQCRARGRAHAPCGHCMCTLRRLLQHVFATPPTKAHMSCDATQSSVHWQCRHRRRDLHCYACRSSRQATHEYNNTVNSKFKVLRAISEHTIHIAHIHAVRRFSRCTMSASK